MPPRPHAQRPLTRARLAEAEATLAARDQRLAAIIGEVGPCTLLPRRAGTHFGHLTRAIVYQQLSGSAAATIHGRLLAALGVPGASPRVTSARVTSVRVTSAREAPEPLAVLDASDALLRGCGLSAGKVRALRDLAAHVVEGRLPLDDLGRRSDEAIIATLVAVRGIGPWTAQMFLMFRLGRPDVLPVLDLGVRKGAQRIYRMRTLPDARRLEQVARNWRPWASVASWYCWRALELGDAGGW